jgi:threonine dehydrogenase-like Zn-dependent dehydrogenase
MRAIRQDGAGQLELIETEAPVPGRGEVLIQVSACGICGSDLSSYKRGLFEGVPGHELAGVIESLGSEVLDWTIGEPAAVYPHTPCRECDQCRQGSGHRCLEDLARPSVRPGGFSELVVAPVETLGRLPSGLSPETACLAEPLAVALHGLDRVQLRMGEGALVIGLGSIGLLAIAALRARGAGPVVGIDPVERRRDLALSLGADTAYACGAQARVAQERSAVVLECSGHPESIGLAIDLAASGGRVGLLGIALAEVKLAPVNWIIHEVSVAGCVNSTPGNHAEALGLLAAQPSVARVITRRVSLAEVPAAFEDLLHPSVDGKVVVDPRR